MNSFDEESTLLTEEVEETQKITGLKQTTKTLLAICSLIVLGSLALLSSSGKFGSPSKVVDFQSSAVPYKPGASICPGTFVKGVTPMTPPDGCIFVAVHQIYYLEPGQTAPMVTICSTKDNGPVYFDGYDLKKLGVVLYPTKNSIISSIIRGTNTLVTFYSGGNFDGDSGDYPMPDAQGALTDRVYLFSETGGKIVSVNDEINSFVFTSSGTTPIDETCGSGLSINTFKYVAGKSEYAQPPGCVLLSVNQLEALSTGQTSVAVRVCATTATSPVKLDAHALAELNLVVDGNSLISSIVQGPQVKVDYYSGASFSGFFDSWSPGPLTIKTYQAPPYQGVNDNVKSVVLYSKAATIPKTLPY